VADIILMMMTTARQTFEISRTLMATMKDPFLVKTCSAGELEKLEMNVGRSQ
jgi:hypothetical protein